MLQHQVAKAGALRGNALKVLQEARCGRQHQQTGLDKGLGSRGQACCRTHETKCMIDEQYISLLCCASANSDYSIRLAKLLQLSWQVCACCCCN
jgi:hypothetical protein